jgi:hypothetical protein
LSESSGCLVQGAGLFEQVRRSRDDLQILFAAELIERLAVQLQHGAIAPADNEQGRRIHQREHRPREIRTASA